MKNILLTLLILTAASTAALSAKGASAPEMWITWRAATYIPSDYSGRPLPVRNSKIVAAVDLFENGRFVDLSEQTIYWYMNDRLLGGGPGEARMPVTIPEAVSRTGVTLRVSMPDYKDGIARTINVIVADPQAVIRTPSRVSGTSFEVRAVPFYFNISDPSELSFDWNISGQKPSNVSDPSLIKVSLGNSVPSGTIIPISLSLSNPDMSWEVASKNTTVIYAP